MLLSATEHYLTLDPVLGIEELMEKSIKKAKEDKTGKFMGIFNTEQSRCAKDQKYIAQKHNQANVGEKKKLI